ncbi:hypothetical protein BC829DRAFT_248582 [Chytridium lagenaria]|nr:hypothetical protein BC829DRAFT_248582 [Chytridium lagenaria]
MVRLPVGVVGRIGDCWGSWGARWGMMERWGRTRERRRRWQRWPQRQKLIGTQDDDDDEEASRRRRRRRERQRRRRGVILDPDSPAARRRGRSEAGEDQAEEGSRRRRQRGVSAGEGSVERMRRRRRAQRTGSNGEYQRRRISGDEAETSLLDPEARQGLRRRRGRRDDGERDGDRDDANTTVISPDMSSPISPTSTGEEGTRRTGASAVARRRRSANGDEDNDGTAGESSSSRRRQLRQQNLQLDVSRRRRRGDPSNSTTASATASSSGQSRSRRLRPPAQSSSTAASPSTSSLRPQVESLSSPQESVTPTTPYTPATPYAADMSPRTAMLMAPPASAVSPIHPNSFGLGEIATPLSVNEEEPSSASTPLNLLSDEVVGTEEEGLRVETGLDTPTSPDFGGATSATPSSASNKGRVSWAVDVEGGAEENMDQEWEQRSSQTPTRLTPLSDLPPYPLSPAEVVAAALSPEPGSLHSLSNPGSPIFGLDIDNTTPTSATGVASGYLDVLDRTDFSNWMTLVLWQYLSLERAWKVVAIMRTFRVGMTEGTGWMTKMGYLEMMTRVGRMRMNRELMASIG